GVSLRGGAGRSVDSPGCGSALSGRWSRKQRAWGGCVAWAPGCRSRCPAGTWYWRGRARRHALGVTAGLRNGHFQRGGAPDAAFGLIRATRLARSRAVGGAAGVRNGRSRRGGAPDAAFGLIRATRLARSRALGVTAGLRNGHSQRGGAPDAAFGLIRATRLARRHALGVTAGLRNGHFQRGGAPDAAFGLIRATRLRDGHFQPGRAPDAAQKKQGIARRKCKGRGDGPASSHLDGGGRGLIRATK